MKSGKRGLSWMWVVAIILILLFIGSFFLPESFFEFAFSPDKDKSARQSSSSTTTEPSVLARNDFANAVCEDSDAILIPSGLDEEPRFTGVNFDVLGETCLSESNPDFIGSNQNSCVMDGCDSEGNVIEYYCDGNQIKSITFECPESLTCVNGVCDIQTSFPEGCPYANSFSDYSTCDYRLAFQGDHTNVELGVYGFNNEAVALSGELFHPFDVTEENFISQAQDFDGVVANLLSIPAVIEIGDSDQLVMVDIERPLQMQQYVNYLDESGQPTQLLDDMLLAFKAYVDAARVAMPNAKLGIWGHQAVPGGTYGQSFDDRMTVYTRAGELGVYENLDYYMPLLYGAFGATDFARNVVIDGNDYDVLRGNNNEHYIFELDGTEVDSAYLGESVNLGGEDYLIAKDTTGKTLLIGQTTYTIEEAVIGKIHDWVDQSIVMTDMLADTNPEWDMPVAPYLNFQIRNGGSNHHNTDLPPYLARVFSDRLQEYDQVEVLQYWIDTWRPLVVDTFETAALVPDSCGCTQTECSDGIDNDFDGVDDLFDLECYGGDNNDRYMPYWNSEQSANLPPNAEIEHISINNGELMPPQDITIGEGDDITFFGSHGDDPEDGMPITFLWDFGLVEFDDDSNSIIPVELDDSFARNIVFPDKGVFEVVYTVFDVAFASDPTPPTMTVTVGEPPSCAEGFNQGVFEWYNANDFSPGDEDIGAFAEAVGCNSESVTIDFYQVNFLGEDLLLETISSQLIGNVLLENWQIPSQAIDTRIYYFTVTLDSDGIVGFSNNVTVTGTDVDGDGILRDGAGNTVSVFSPCSEDNFVDCDDNCAITFNPGQDDSDNDGVGDACDLFPNGNNGNSCPGDVNGDGVINIDDNTMVSQNVGMEDNICDAANGVPCPGDANGDGQITTDDIFIVVSNWGNVC